MSGHRGELIPSARVATVLLGLGATLTFAGLVLIESVPTSLSEFAYLEGSPLRPLPFAAMRGFTVEQAFDHATRIVLVGPGLLALGLGLSHWIPTNASLPWPPSWIALALAVLGLALTAYTTVALIGGRAITDDELTYAVQASLLLEGRLGMEPLPGLVDQPFFVLTRQGLTGKYLFGEPLVQALGVVLGLPTIGHLVAYVITLFATFRAARRLSGSVRVASGSVGLLALSPMIVLCTGTGHSQPAALACVAVACAGYAAARDGLRLGPLVVALALGFGLTVRPQSLAPAAMVLAPATLALLVRRRAWEGVALLVLPLGCLLALVMTYDHALTGSPFVLPWSLAEGGERYGFGLVFDTGTYTHGVREAFENVVVSSIRLNTWWLGWPLGLGLVLVWAAVGRPSAGSRTWAALALTHVAFHLPYYSTGISDVGPIYWYELVLPLSVLGAAALDRALALAPRITVAMLLVQIGIGTTSFYSSQVRRLDRLLTAVHGETEAVLAELPTPAIVLHDTRCAPHRWLGWVASSFPKRWLSEADPIVTYPLPEPARLDAYLARHPGRRCFYAGVDPATGRLVAMPCETVPGLRDASLLPVNRCLRPLSTARSLPWLVLASALVDGPAAANAQAA